MEPQVFKFENEQVVLAAHTHGHRTVIVVIEYRNETPHNGFIVPIHGGVDRLLPMAQEIAKPMHKEFIKRGFIDK
jgi:hypothetical protein